MKSRMISWIALVALIGAALACQPGATVTPETSVPLPPTEEPTDAPTDEPTEAPTEEPTDAPTDAPTEAPTDEPTEAPTDTPTDEPPEEVVPFVTISSPGDGAELSPFGFTVSGEGGALFEGGVAVEVLDAGGNQLAIQPTIIDSPEAGTGGSGPWSLDMSMSSYTGAATIHAFATSPRDGAIVAEDSVSVTFNEFTTFVIITTPDDGATLDPAAFTVSGEGGALFEGSVEVEVLDADGNQIAILPTIIDSLDAGVGGHGPWSLDFSIAYTGEATIHAFTTSPRDGAIEAEDWSSVTFE